MASGVRHLVLGSALAVAIATACYTGPSANDGFLPVGVPSDPATETAPTTPEELTGLPCDVAKVLANNCTSCHGRTLEGDAETRLLSRDDLRATFKGHVVGELSLERIFDPDSPMPPDSSISEDEIAVFQKWVDDGMPAGSCGESVTAGDDDDAAPEPVTLTCTSGTRWTRGNHESKLMKPGSPCILCHLTGRAQSDHDDEDDDDDFEQGPLYYFAGTVYPSPHDEDDCNGSDAVDTTTVVLTGADGKVLTLPINKAGNFYTKKALAMPVKAQVVSAAGTKTMKDPVEDGDCNGCHTAESFSPGRIVEKR